MKYSGFISVLSFILSLIAFNAQAEVKTAIFAGGCFWCMEKDFEHVSGVTMVESGYTGGSSKNPGYKNYSRNNHIEAVRISYNSDKVTYDKLLHIFWRSVDPTDAGGQFCDRGHAYSTAIFALNSEQNNQAKKSKQQLMENNPLATAIVTPIIAANKFWPAEDYHQDYYKKNPFRYSLYRRSCGRDTRIKKLWGKEAHSGITY